MTLELLVEGFEIDLIGSDEAVASVFHGVGLGFDVKGRRVFITTTSE